jgi:hypothetical protein
LLFRLMTDTPVIEWSYSKRDLLSKCNRRYYYQYYGFSKKTALEEPDKQAIQSLKNLETIPLHMGNTLHLIIQKYFKKAQGGEIWSLDRLLSWAGKISREDLAYNRQYNRNHHPAEADPYKKLLLEFYYQLKNAEKSYAESYAKLTKGLTNFYNSEIYEDFRKNGVTPEASAEKKFSLDRWQYKVRGKIDLTYKKGNKIVIVDWKLGNSGGGDESLQLLSYATSASNEEKLPPENIQICMAHLNANVATMFPVTNENLSNAEARIAQDVETMTYLDRYGRVAAVDAFSRCDQLKICTSCQYQTICHGRVINGDA